MVEIQHGSCLYLAVSGDSSCCLVPLRHSIEMCSSRAAAIACRYFSVSLVRLTVTDTCRRFISKQLRPFPNFKIQRVSRRTKLSIGNRCNYLSEVGWHSKPKTRGGKIQVELTNEAAAFCL